ncbi:4237_t:CDS:2 [Acaulospora morrowiae]|uniref:4237_t:CDS:1 n=1 Tax=Acaulospora morrowiae TaxID=94023 RepID=A0A9N8Z253_9GLOM|nr:4237_t:CDS:2 [Acaulospora morrowiae]
MALAKSLLRVVKIEEQNILINKERFRTSPKNDVPRVERALHIQPFLGNTQDKRLKFKDSLQPGKMEVVWCVMNRPIHRSICCTLVALGGGY